ncbi:Trans-2,3-enoyl-CoA reductase, partial [Chelonia mydas]
PKWYPARQSIRLDPKGKSLRDEEILQHLPVGTTATLYFKDLGPQIGWTMVFLTEYAGPLFIYFLFYFRMPFVYGLDDKMTSSPHPVVNLACICHSFHYIKRLIETIFVHRFSHGTMPLRNIIKLRFSFADNIFLNQQLRAVSCRVSRMPPPPPQHRSLPLVLASLTGNILEW